jgi:hypothetical protein
LFGEHLGGLGGGNCTLADRQPPEEDQSGRGSLPRAGRGPVGTSFDAGPARVPSVADHTVVLGGPERPDQRGRTRLIQPFPEGERFSGARRAGCFSRTISRFDGGSGSAKPEDVERLSPLSLDHVSVLGRYEFTLAKSVRQGKLRQLRDPEQPDDLAA